MKILPRRLTVERIALFVVGIVAGVAFTVAVQTFQTIVQNLETPVTKEVTVPTADAQREIDNLVNVGGVESAGKLIDIAKIAIEGAEAIK